MCLGVCPSLFLFLQVVPHCFVELASHMALGVSVLARDTLILCLTDLYYCSSCTAPVDISGVAGPTLQSSDTRVTLGRAEPSPR